jgi:glycosyltransferase involved in cell wall biosynthesis
MKIFVFSAHNKPSGGTKVLNQVVNLFIDHGHDACLVIPDKSEVATFIDNPAPTCDYKDVKKLCTSEDIIIDGWQWKEAWNLIKSVPAKEKIFWQHGASIPKGKQVVGDIIYKKGHPYTQFWNVSQACAEYIKEKYNIKKIGIVHPFFDTSSIKTYIDQKNNLKNNLKREGILMLDRRGKKHIKEVIKKFGDKQKITVLQQPYHEEDFFKLLLTHKFFISVDPGVDNHFSLIKKIKDIINSIFNSEFREKHSNRATWIIPKGHLLGFPMPPVEAALLGCSVIGFAMGGGLEWMNKNNCFIVKDRNTKDLLNQINIALSSSDEELSNKIIDADIAASKFTKEHTWKQLKKLLDI